MYNLVLLSYSEALSGSNKLPLLTLHSLQENAESKVREQWRELAVDGGCGEVRDHVNINGKVHI